MQALDPFPRPRPLRWLALLLLSTALTLAGCGGGGGAGTAEPSGSPQSAEPDVKAQDTPLERISAASETTATAASVLLGQAGEGDTTDPITDAKGAWINAGRFVALGDGSVTELKAKLGALSSGGYRVAVYADASGSPGALLAQSAEQAAASTGWHSFPLGSAVALTKGSAYWLAVWSGNPAAKVFANRGRGLLRWGRYAYGGDWPAQLRTTAGAALEYAIYAAAPAPAAAGPVLGNNGEGSITDTLTDASTAWINASRFVAGSAAPITTVHAKVQGISGEYQVAVYADAGGRPGALLAEGAPLRPGSTGWASFALRTPVTAVAGQAYWLAIWSNDPASRVFADPDGGQLVWGAYPYGTRWPDSWTVAGTSAYRYAIYATTGSALAPAQPPAVPPPASRSAARLEASRFLAQASFGATRADLDALEKSSFPAWLDAQFALPMRSFDTLTADLVNRFYGGNFGDGPIGSVEAIWRQFAYGDDQLRQRTTWALSQIFVVGDSTTPRTYGIGPAFWDAMQRNAFGNYRQLLQDVSYSTAMGLYLSYSGNAKEDPATGASPDENYARELMQLFTIGLWMLNPDGSQQLDAQGRPIPTYGQAEIQGTAKVFTGLAFERCKNLGPNEPMWVCFEMASRLGWNASKKLAAFDDYHSKAEKRIVGGRLLPANRGADADIKDTLDALFNHPNVGPFIGRQLIQRFVTSNPSPAYVGRVAAAFNNNGSGVRGDMKAVLRAILLDPEARDTARALSNPGFGKVREPVLRWVNFLRSFTRANPNGRAYYDFNRMIPAFGQWPWSSPSVFNFYRPTYRPPGPLAQAGLVAPELQILHEYTIAATHNEFEMWTAWNVDGSGGEHINDYGWLIALAADPVVLVDRLDELLTYGSLSADSRSTLINALAQVPNTTDRAKMAMRLFLVSPDYMVLK